jgi:hypothetical protein
MDGLTADLQPYLIRLANKFIKSLEVKDTFVAQYIQALNPGDIISLYQLWKLLTPAQRSLMLTSMMDANSGDDTELGILCCLETCLLTSGFLAKGGQVTRLDIVEYLSLMKLASSSGVALAALWSGSCPVSTQARSS